MSCRISKESFNRIIQDSLESLPEKFAEALETVSIEVLDRPTLKIIKDAKLSPGVKLLGLYHGRPLIQRGVHDTGAMPDVIYLFQRELEAVCDSEEEIRKQVRITLLHEIGHFYGLDEDDLKRLGYG